MNKKDRINKTLTCVLYNVHQHARSLITKLRDKMKLNCQIAYTNSITSLKNFNSNS